MNTILGTERSSFEDLVIKIDFTDSKQAIFDRIKNHSTRGELPRERNTSKALLNVAKPKDEDYIYFYTSAEGEISDKIPREAVRQFIISNVTRVIQRSIFPNVLIFPTERTTFISIP